MMEHPARLLKLNSTPVITCYHPFILIVSFCVLSSLIIKHENIIIILLLSVCLSSLSSFFL